MPKTTTTPGQRVRAARQAAGLTQAKLAARAGLHVMTVRKIELGSLSLSVEAALALAAELGIRPGSLMASCPHCHSPL